MSQSFIGVGGLEGSAPGFTGPGGAEGRAEDGNQEDPRLAELATLNYNGSPTPERSCNIAAAVNTTWRAVSDVFMTKMPNSRRQI